MLAVLCWLLHARARPVRLPEGHHRAAAPLSLSLLLVADLPACLPACQVRMAMTVTIALLIGAVFWGKGHVR